MNDQTLPFVAALLALWLDLALGRIVPVRLDLLRLGAERLAAAASRRLDRPKRGASVLRARGGILLALVAAGGAAPGFAVPAAGEAAVWVHAGFLLACCGLGRAWTRPAPAGEAPAVRIAIETLVTAPGRHLVLPLVAYLAAGLPGAGAVAALDAAASRLAQPSGRIAAFAVPVEVAARLLAWLPALAVAAALATAAVFVPGCRPSSAFRALARSALEPDATLPVTAAALGLALGGPLPGAPARSWFGEGTARAEHGHYLRARLLALFVPVLGTALLAFGLTRAAA